MARPGAIYRSQKELLFLHEAEEFFGAGEAPTPAAQAILDRLADVGLGYLSQPLTTLSGGEPQRLKLATRMGQKGCLRPR
jgi:excinuclease UvrABC ATPase subunit